MVPHLPRHHHGHRDAWRRRHRHGGQARLGGRAHRAAAVLHLRRYLCGEEPQRGPLLLRRLLQSGPLRDGRCDERRLAVRAVVRRLRLRGHARRSEPRPQAWPVARDDRDRAHSGRALHGDEPADDVHGSERQAHGGQSEQRFLLGGRPCRKVAWRTVRRGQCARARHFHLAVGHDRRAPRCCA